MLGWEEVVPFSYQRASKSFAKEPALNVSHAYSCVSGVADLLLLVRLFRAVVYSCLCVGIFYFSSVKFQSVICNDPLYCFCSEWWFLTIQILTNSHHDDDDNDDDDDETLLLKLWYNINCKSIGSFRLSICARLSLLIDVYLLHACRVLQDPSCFAHWAPPCPCLFIMCLASTWVVCIVCLWGWC